MLQSTSTAVDDGNGQASNSKYNHSQNKSNKLVHPEATNSLCARISPIATLESAPHHSLKTVEKSNVQFSNNQNEENWPNHLSAQSDLFDLYGLEKPASFARSKINQRSQPPDPSESVLYGKTFESQNFSQLPVVYKIRKPNGYPNHTRRYLAQNEEPSSQYKMVDQSRIQSAVQFAE